MRFSTQKITQNFDVFMAKFSYKKSKNHDKNHAKVEWFYRGF